MGCAGKNDRGEPCGMAPLKREAWCFSHHPDRDGDRAAARKRGGRRNRAAGTVLTLAEDESALPLELGDMKAVQTALNLIWRDTLRQENSAQRSRTLVAVALAAMKALEVGEYEERIRALEQAVQQPNQWRGRAA
jgi:hypothetical protein